MYKDSCCFYAPQVSCHHRCHHYHLPPGFLWSFPHFQIFHFHHQPLGLLPSSRIKKGVGAGRICSKMPISPPSCSIWLDCSCFLLSERGSINPKSFWSCFLCEAMETSAPSVGHVRRGCLRGGLELAGLDWRALSSWISWVPQGASET